MKSLVSLSKILKLKMSTPVKTKKFHSNIYRFYEFERDDGKNSYWKCKTCNLIREKSGTSTTNLIVHLKEKHELTSYKEFQELNNPNSPLITSNANKRMRLETPIKGLFTASTAKYSQNSVIQKSRFKNLADFLIKAMLPVSIVETSAFRDFYSTIDPSFNIPNVRTLKNNGNFYFQTKSIN